MGEIRAMVARCLTRVFKLLSTLQAYSSQLSATWSSLDVGPVLQTHWAVRVTMSVSSQTEATKRHHGQRPLILPVHCPCMHHVNLPLATTCRSQNSYTTRNHSRCRRPNESSPYSGNNTMASIRGHLRPSTM